MPSFSDTIAAIATAPGAAGIGIIRVSGAEALAVSDRVFAAASGTPLAKTPGGRAVYGRIVGDTAETIDEAIALVMRAPHSYTREDVVELQWAPALPSAANSRSAPSSPAASTSRRRRPSWTSSALAPTARFPSPKATSRAISPAASRPCATAASP